MSQPRFVDLPPEAFPIRIEAFNSDGALVWSETVEGPGALQVPPLRQEHGEIRMRFSYGNGTVIER